MNDVEEKAQYQTKCDTVSPRRQTLLEELRSEQARMIRSLAKINKKIDLLENDPYLANKIDEYFLSNDF